MSPKLSLLQEGKRGSQLSKSWANIRGAARAGSTQACLQMPGWTLAEGGLSTFHAISTDSGTRDRKGWGRDSPLTRIAIWVPDLRLFWGLGAPRCHVCLAAVTCFAEPS